MILLYESNEIEFENNGLGGLSDAISCTVTEERNGVFELELQYPITGIHYGDIVKRRIVMAKPNPTGDPQPFRIYRMTKPINGQITVYAEHISYDLSGVPVSPFTAHSAVEAMANLKNNAAITTPFVFWTDKSTIADMTVSVPSSTRALFGGQTGSILDVYGGEYEFDRFDVKLYSQRGQNRGVSIRYGKNLTDLTQEENIQNVYTGVYPYWYSDDDGLVTLSEKIVNASGTYDYDRVMPLDLSDEFEDMPEEDALRAAAQSYMVRNNFGIPSISLSVSFAQLEQTEEYKGKALLERVSLCDTVNVEFPALGVSATAKCVKTVYNVLLNRYDSVELGDARTNIADTIINQQREIEESKTETKSLLQQAIDNATSLITGNKGGYIVLNDTDGNGQPDEILVMDTPNVETATKVWRWNKSGLGYSSNGYNGPYGLAMTQEGEIVANYITTGVLTASLIKAGVLQSVNGVTSLNMESGDMEIDQGSFTMQLDEIGLSLMYAGQTVAFMSGNMFAWPNPRGTIGAGEFRITDDSASKLAAVPIATRAYVASGANPALMANLNNINTITCNAITLNGSRIFVKSDGTLYVNT